MEENKEKKPENPPAFPEHSIDVSGGNLTKEKHYQPGMTLRDYFAAKAMNAITCSIEYQEGVWSMEEISTQSYQMADAMLKERSKYEH